VQSSSAATRELSDGERKCVRAARGKAHALYEGVLVPHRSCGIALAETFDLPSASYQSLRRGGITGCGACGSIRAGELILGELLGDPDPTGSVTDALRGALSWYQEQVPKRFEPSASGDYICNNLTAPHGDFSSNSRKEYCTKLAAEVAALTAEAVLRFGPSGLVIRPLSFDKEPSHAD